MSSIKLYNGDCLEVMRSMTDKSVDAVITDPPYELGFMGKKWDSSGIAFQPETWQAVYRVLKPGALLLAFGGTRTYHRMVCAIEDAGFEIRDTIAWIYGSGFPKSYDISKGIDKQAGIERTVPRVANKNTATPNMVGTPKQRALTAPSTPEAQLWHGWGTALKPAMELICVAMKPIDGTYVNNALTWGVAGFWIDGGRVEGKPRTTHKDGNFTGNSSKSAIFPMPNIRTTEPQGRFPANVIHDGSDEVVSGFPNTTSGKVAAGTMRGLKSNHNVAYADIAAGTELTGYGDSGSAARFFYCAKASRSERNAGLEGMGTSRNGMNFGGKLSGNGKPINIKAHTNSHPTVKPLALMRYLARLTKTPTGGVVLDPFMGSGTTGMAAVMEGRDFIGIEIDPDYFAIAERRIQEAQLQLRLPLEVQE
jgi:site-specific DNA-methyltransferase (adenine-specific)